MKGPGDMWMLRKFDEAEKIDLPTIFAMRLFHDEWISTRCPFQAVPELSEPKSAKKMRKGRERNLRQKQLPTWDLGTVQAGGKEGGI